VAEERSVKVQTGEVLTGSHGSATELICTREAEDRPATAATVASWFIWAPNQSPAWECCGLSAVHLRIIPGCKPPVLLFPDATHELLLAAFDPREKPSAVNPESWFFLRPLNFVAQLRLGNDASIAQLLRMCAQEVVQGRLWAEPPYNGSREPWRSFLRLRSIDL
jgi:hypothetical protein